MEFKALLSFFETIKVLIVYSKHAEICHFLYNWTLIILFYIRCGYAKGIKNESKKFSKFDLEFFNFIITWILVALFSMIHLCRIRLLARCHIRLIIHLWGFLLLFLELRLLLDSLKIGRRYYLLLMWCFVAIRHLDNYIYQSVENVVVILLSGTQIKTFSDWEIEYNRLHSTLRKIR